MDWGAWRAAVHGVAKSRTQLSDWTELNRTPWKESYHQPKEQIKKQRHYFVNKDPSRQGDGSSSSHEWMWGLDYKGSWEEKNWCF